MANMFGSVTSDDQQHVAAVNVLPRPVRARAIEVTGGQRIERRNHLRALFAPVGLQRGWRVCGRRELGIAIATRLA